MTLDSQLPDGNSLLLLGIQFTHMHSTIKDDTKFMTPSQLLRSLLGTPPACSGTRRKILCCRVVMNSSHIQNADLGLLISNLGVAPEKRCHEECAFNMGRDDDSWWLDHFNSQSRSPVRAGSIELGVLSLLWYTAQVLTTPRTSVMVVFTLELEPV